MCVCVHVCVDKQRCRLVLLLTELQESISRAAAGPSSLPTERSQNPRLKALNNCLQFHSVYAAPLSTGSASKDVCGLSTVCLIFVASGPTRKHTHARALLENRAPNTSHYPTLISHLLVHTCAQATEKWTPGVRSGVIHHAASGRRVDIRKGTRSAAIVIESPCLF